ncbi:MAG: DHHW family protein [Lachnospiraceae bacterium]
MKRMDHKNSWMTMGIFVLLIMGLSVASLLKKDRTFSATENRYLAKRPAFSPESFIKGDFSSDYETYITDQFILRDRWIYVKTRTEMAFGKKDVNGVYLSKDNYLIEMHNDVDEVKAYANADRMTDFLSKQKEVLGEDHVMMLIAPTAVNILKDKLPMFAQTFDQDAYLDYLDQSVKSKDAGEFVDIRETFLQHGNMDQEYVYYRTDHHWTTYGAYLAYQDWAKTAGVEAYDIQDFDVELVSTDFLGTVYSKLNYAKQEDQIEIFRFKKEAPMGPVHYAVDINMGQKTMDSFYKMEHLETKDQYSVFLDGNNSVVCIDTTGVTEHREEEETTLLLIKDSYAHCFVPFLANHYDHIVMIDLRYLKMPMSQVLEKYAPTDILVLYNAIHFAEDMNLSLLDY